MNLAWPIQNIINLHPELLEPKLDSRTICKSSMIYRFWTRSRKLVVRAWEATVSAAFDGAKKGSSALTAAAARSLKCEVAQRANQKVGVILFDMHNFPIRLSLSPSLSRGRKLTPHL